MSKRESEFGQQKKVENTGYADLRARMIARGINPDEGYFDIDFQKAAILRLGIDPDKLDLNDEKHAQKLFLAMGNAMMNNPLLPPDVREFYDTVTGGRFG